MAKASIQGGHLTFLLTISEAEAGALLAALEMFGGDPSTPRRHIEAIRLALVDFNIAHPVSPGGRLNNILGSPFRQRLPHEDWIYFAHDSRDA